MVLAVVIASKTNNNFWEYSCFLLHFRKSNVPDFLHFAFLFCKNHYQSGSSIDKTTGEKGWLQVVTKQSYKHIWWNHQSCLTKRVCILETKFGSYIWNVSVSVSVSKTMTITIILSSLSCCTTFAKDIL